MGSVQWYVGKCLIAVSLRRKALICRIVQFLWYKYYHHGLFKVPMVLIIGSQKFLEIQPLAVMSWLQHITDYVYQYLPHYNLKNLICVSNNKHILVKNKYFQRQKEWLRMALFESLHISLMTRVIN